MKKKNIFSLWGSDKHPVSYFSLDTITPRITMLFTNWFDTTWIENDSFEVTQLKVTSLKNTSLEIKSLESTLH